MGVCTNFKLVPIFFGLFGGEGSFLPKEVHPPGNQSKSRTPWVLGGGGFLVGEGGDVWYTGAAGGKSVTGLQRLDGMS